MGVMDASSNERCLRAVRRCKRMPACWDASCKKRGIERSHAAPTMRSMPEDDHGKKQFSVAAQASEWDARYSEPVGALWSGRPNGRLVVEVGSLTPGRALDVGCGEGADAIWLALRGWTVTAIDISAVAIGRAQPSWPAPRSSGSAETPCRRRSQPGRST